MNIPIVAAQRILQRATKQKLEQRGALVMAAAASLVEKAEPNGAWQMIATFSDPGLAFLIAVSAEAQVPLGRRERLMELGLAIPFDKRPGVLSCTECFLARINPVWAWSLIEALLGPEVVSAHGSLGLDIAAQMDKGQAVRWSWPSTWMKANRPFMRQLQADSVARAAIRGQILSLDAPELAALHEKSSGRGFLPSEASSYLVAAAVLDPAWALDEADIMLNVYSPNDLLEAFYLVAQAAVTRGSAPLIVERSQHPAFIEEQACWTAAAASASILQGDDLVKQVQMLAPRVLDELDAGRELIAGLPLLLSLAHGNAIHKFAELAVNWRVPPPLLANHLFYQEAYRAVSNSYGVFQQLLTIPEVEWCTTYNYDFGWWLDAVGSPEERLLACRDILAVAEGMSWHPVPGSLADIVHWPGLHSIYRS